MRPRRPWRILTHEFLPFRGGVATYLAELSSALVRLGETVEIWAPGQPVAPTENVTLRNFAGRMSPGWPHLLRWGRQGWIHRKELTGASVLLGSYGAIRLGLELSRWRWIDPASVYPLFHGSEIARLTATNSLRRRTRTWLTTCPAVLAASPHAARLLRASGLLENEARLVVAPCALPEAFRAPDLPQARDPGDGEFRILTLARVHPRKGQLDVARALSQLPEILKARVLYQIAGPAQGDYASRVMQACREGGVRFIHLGAIATDQLPATYAQAHLHVMTSRTLRDSVEGFGLVYLEAAACGLTSIASNSGGCPDAVCDGETGVVVEEGNLPALMAAIEQMMTDSVLRQRLAAEARSRALEQTWEDSARAIVELTREG